MLGKVSKRSVGFDVCPQNIHKNRLPIKTHEVVKINSTVLQQSFSNKDLEWWLLYFFFLGVNVKNFLHLGSSQNKLFKPDEVACCGVFFFLSQISLSWADIFYLGIFPKMGGGVTLFPKVNVRIVTSLECPCYILYFFGLWYCLQTTF